MPGKPLGERVARLEEAFEHIPSEIKGLRVDMVGGQRQIIDRLDTANTAMANVKKAQHLLEGGLAMLKWMIGIALLGIGAGGTVAGAILFVVLR